MGFNDFIGLQFIAWVLVYFLHAILGGLTNIFYKHFAKDDRLTIVYD